MKYNPDRTRAVQLNIRLTEPEVEEIRDQARRRGVSLARLVLASVRHCARLEYTDGFAPPADRPKGPAENE